MAELTCKGCSAVFYERKRRKYCSKSCFEKHYSPPLKYDGDKKQRRLMVNIKSTMSRFGKTIDDYFLMFENQQGKCGCCGKHQDQEPQRLQIDHCHKTNQIRGLLCWDCNAGIGKLGDDLEGVKNAIRYLENTNGG